MVAMIVSKVIFVTFLGPSPSTNRSIPTSNDFIIREIMIVGSTASQVDNLKSLVNIKVLIN